MAHLQLSIGTSAFPGAEAQRQALEAVKAAGVREVDTAEMYGSNEADIGAANGGDLGLIFSTKNIGGFRKDNLAPENLIRVTNESLQKLKLPSVDILYIHGPDRTERGKPENWVPTMDKLHKQGLFKRFGVSNFSPDEVRAVYDYSKANGYVQPTVFQGNYNPVARQIESDLFPVLRELGIVFYAYSPLAGGFLTKTRAGIADGNDAGRFREDKDKPLNVMYRNIYNRDGYLNALDRWGELAKLQDASKAELAYRWVYYHSALKPDIGDVLIMGASRVEQIGNSVEGLKKGPLKEEVVKGINAVWDLVKADAKYANNYESVIS